MSQSLSGSIRSSREFKYSFLWALLILLSGRFFFMVYFVNVNCEFIFSGGISHLDWSLSVQNDFALHYFLGFSLSVKAQLLFLPKSQVEINFLVISSGKMAEFFTRLAFMDDEPWEDSKLTEITSQHTMHTILFSVSTQPVSPNSLDF